MLARGGLHVTLFFCVVIVLQVLVGTPENPWLFACLRDLLDSYPSARDVIALLLCLDLLALLALQGQSMQTDHVGGLKRRRPSLRTRTLLWFRAKLWALKGSRVRGFRRRHPDSIAVEVPPKSVEAPDNDTTSTVANSAPGSPESSWSNMSRQTSPAMSRQTSPLRLPEVFEEESLHC
uniref:Uncharacterized protein n=1 Tax=Alexandrium andersonii TaxID=327968 RepID=A0A7S2IXX2_9DINO|mmetsp:Transcript_90480/g.202427  ORF Transcript_90480/g.202427 Transcript_90480/m.202427 type:complete len:178 (+) Transcript_90480:58-591(+)